MKLTLDLESRSRVDLRKRGLYVYAEDPSTDILCIAFRDHLGGHFLYIPEKFQWMNEGWLNEGYYSLIDKKEVTTLIENATIIEAHNAAFEYWMWKKIMHERYSFPELPIQKLRCSAAKAAYYALPRSLENACQALSLTQTKDKEGYRIMLKMCKPRRETLYNKADWHENPEEFKKLCAYCIQDVEAEFALSEALPDIPIKEQELWVLDHEINNRGIGIDKKGVENLKSKVREKQDLLLIEARSLTNGFINSTRQGEATKKWMSDNGLTLADLTKDTVETILQEDIPANVRRLLEIRQALAKASVAKLDSMLNRMCKDKRVRGTMLYHGASTGRWAGQGVQVHNFPRDTYPSKDIESVLKLDTPAVELLYDGIMDTASRCLRGMIMAGPGKTLFCADFAAIEARVLAWLAGEVKILEAFRNDKDIYKVAAADIFNTTYEAVTKDQRQIGKTSVLALGYQGWLGAFQAMAKNYGITIEDDKAEDIIRKWREANPSIKSYWYDIEQAATLAIKEKKVYSCGIIKFAMRNDFLHCRLPSGRLLSYYKPHFTRIKTKYGQEKEAITFMGVNSVSKAWQIQHTYSGKLVENIVQAVARDLLAEALLRIEKAGYNITMHCHDEIVCEEPENTNKTLKEFEELMAVNPAWAKGLPLKAEGWIGKRYRK